MNYYIIKLKNEPDLYKLNIKYNNKFYYYL